ncbi:MAG: Ig-like domain-containing protein [Anaerolineae bacterium]|jgi:hypothetical protein
MRVTLVALMSLAIALLPFGYPAQMSAQAQSSVGSVDPAYRALLGGDGNDQATAIAVGPDGTVYLAGFTTSAGFPTPDALPQGSAAFVVGLDSQGQVVFGTLLDGSADDGALALAVGADGSLYVAGWTGSADFPTTPGAFDTSFNGGTQPGIPHTDAFVARIDPVTGQLLYSTFLGGSGTSQRSNEYAAGLAVDAAGHAYVVGGTDSTDFPTTAGAFDTAFGEGQGDGFVTKLSPDGSSLIYSTFLGGTTPADPYTTEQAARIVVDGAGMAYILGRTNATDFPGTAGSPPGGSDFLAALSADGSTLTHSALVDGARGLVLTAAGEPLVAGETDSGEGAGLWLRHFADDWAAPEPRFHLAGTGAETLSALAWGAEGLYLAGLSAATDLPDLGIGDFTGQRPYFLRLSADGRQLLQWASLGEGTEIITGLVCGPEGGVRLGGYATGSDTADYQALVLGFQINLPPIAQDDTVTLTGIEPTLILPLANDTDPEGDTLLLLDVSTPTWGSVEITEDRLGLLYHPGTGQETTATFVYSVGDGRGGMSEATVTVLIPQVSGVAPTTASVYLPLVPLRP